MGLVSNGYTKGMVQNIDRNLLRHALETIKETGRSADGAQIIGKWRFRALLYFEPKIRRHVKSIVVTQTAKTKAQIIKPAKPALIRLVNADFVGLISAAVSRGLAQDHRDDVIADMVEAVLTGNLKCEEIDRRAKEFVAARFKSDHNGYGDLSLDVPIHVEGSATLLDRLSTEVGTGYWDLNMMASTGRKK